MTTIEEAVVAQLESEVTELQYKGFAISAPEKQPVPYWIYQRVSTNRLRTLSSQGTYTTSFDITVYATTAAEARRLIELIRVAFEDEIGQYTSGAPTVQRNDILNEDEGYEVQTGLYYGSLEIEFMYN
jgi:hypothetical protein